jgi:hypothetical protein
MEKKYKLGCIYPNNFSGFKYESRYKNITEAREDNRPFLHIPDSAKPLPIIYRSHSSMNTGDLYNIKAQIIELPLSNYNIILNSLEGLLAPVHELSINLMSPTQKTLCLLVDQEPTKLKKVDTFSPEFFPMSFFVEGHVSCSIECKNLLEIIDKSVPNLADRRAPINSLSFTDSHVYIKKASDGVNDPSERTAYLTTGDVRILFREPNIIGFYVPADIDKLIYRDQISALRTSIRKFDRNIQYNTNYKCKFHVDFISDKRMINLLNLPRVLESSEIQEIIKQNPDFEETREWLKKQ